MTRLTLKVALLSILVLLSHILIVIIRPVNQTRYLAATIDKHKTLENLDSPKVILVGGSNLVFSIDSKALQDEFDLPVINMGLHANLGLRYILNEVKYQIDSDDIIIVMPEYEHFIDTPLDGGGELASLWEQYPESTRHMRSIGQFRTLIGSHPKITRSALYKILVLAKNSTPYQVCNDGIYCRENFNSYGDITGNDGTQEINIGMGLSSKPGDRSLEVVEMLNGFNDFSNNAGATVYFLFPAIPEESFLLDNEERFNELFDFLSENLQIQILNTPNERLYSNSYFYDTIYHMNEQGRRLRTQHIIDDLSQVLRTPNDN